MLTRCLESGACPIWSDFWRLEGCGPIQLGLSLANGRFGGGAGFFSAAGSSTESIDFVRETIRALLFLSEADMLARSPAFDGCGGYIAWGRLASGDCCRGGVVTRMFGVDGLGVRDMRGGENNGKS